MGVVASLLHLNQGTLIEGKGSVQLTSLYEQVEIRCFGCNKHYLLFFYKTGYLIEEVNCTEPSLTVSIPSFFYTLNLDKDPLLKGRISAVDLLLVTSSDQLLFIVKLYFFFVKTSCLN